MYEGFYYVMGAFFFNMYIGMCIQRNLTMLWQAVNIMTRYATHPCYNVLKD